MWYHFRWYFLTLGSTFYRLHGKNLRLLSNEAGMGAKIRGKYGVDLHRLLLAGDA